MAYKVYLQRESEIVFKSSGGTVAFTPTSVANGAGHISAQYDVGVAPKPRLFRWRAKTALAATPTLGNLIRVYLSCADDTSDLDGNASTSDAAYNTQDKLRNLQQIGNIIIDVAGTGAQKGSSLGSIEIASRYVSVVWWNAGGSALSSTASDHQFVLIPLPDEIQ